MISFDVGSYDYKTSELTQLVPDIAATGISRIGVQRLPDTRVHCVLGDGTVAVAVINRLEEVLAWVLYETDGDVEDVVVLPAEDENRDDRVYYIVNRTINGSTKRYLELISQEEDTHGGAQCLLADSHITYSGAATATLTGLTHLEGESVVVWATGTTTDLSATTYTVTAGAITLPETVTSAVIGLGYEARFKSAKLGLAVREGFLGKPKRVPHLGLLLADTHSKGLQIGPDYTVMDALPLVESGTTVGATDIYTDYDEDPIEFPGGWTADARVCIKVSAPYPATVLAVTVELEQA
jgi:hypothetical protein